MALEPRRHAPWLDRGWIVASSVWTCVSLAAFREDLICRAAERPWGCGLLMPSRRAGGPPIPPAWGRRCRRPTPLGLQCRAADRARNSTRASPSEHLCVCIHKGGWMKAFLVVFLVGCVWAVLLKFCN